MVKSSSVVAGIALAFACSAGAWLGAGWSSEAWAQAAAKAPTALPASGLASHRAVYDLSLADSGGSIQAAKGRVVYEITGTTCEGYASRSRQVVVLEGESTSTTTDMRMTTFEDGNGGKFRFKAETRNANSPPKLIDGEAVRQSDAIAVNFVKPSRETVKLGDAMFPAAHLKALIGGAQGGKPVVEARVFDGSDDGRSFYDTLAVIGRADAAKAATKSPDETDESFAERQRRFDALFGTAAHWPISISYFKQATVRGEALPVYVLTFDLYDNGIARSLTLKYDSFTLKGELKELELLQAAACE